MKYVIVTYEIINYHNSFTCFRHQQQCYLRSLHEQMPKITRVLLSPILVMVYLTFAYQCSWFVRFFLADFLMCFLLSTHSSAELYVAQFSNNIMDMMWLYKQTTLEFPTIIKHAYIMCIWLALCITCKNFIEFAKQVNITIPL